MVDAGWLFGDEEFSDAQLVLVEEVGEGQEEAGGGGAAAARDSARDGESNAASTSGQGGAPAPKRARASSGASSGAGAANGAESLVLPIHRAFVMHASTVLKARLGAWQQSGSSAAPCRVVLHVPAGQLELGRRLVRAMCEAAPGLGDLSAEQQLQLLRLADRYDAPTVLKAAAAAAGIDVAVLADKGLSLAAVQTAYPPAGSRRRPVAALRPYAADALQLLFGDLEAVWASPDAVEKQQQLLALPHAALHALLADERTRVASENTVMYTVERWVAEHELEPSTQVDELLALVRVARLTPHYARSVFCEIALDWAHLSPRKLALAAMLPLIDEDTAGLELDGAITENWRLPARPRSALADALVLEWTLRLSQIKAGLRDLVAAGAGSKYVDGPKGVVWQGWPLRLEMVCIRDASGGVMFDLYLKTKPPSLEAMALISRVFEAVSADGGSGVEHKPGPCLYMSGGSTMWGSKDFFRLKTTGEGIHGSGGAGPPTDWAGVEAALRAARLVHDDGAEAHVKLRCVVTEIK